MILVMIVCPEIMSIGIIVSWIVVWSVMLFRVVNLLVMILKICGVTHNQYGEVRVRVILSVSRVLLWNLCVTNVK